MLQDLWGEMKHVGDFFLVLPRFACWFLNLIALLFLLFIAEVCSIKSLNPDLQASFLSGGCIASIHLPFAVIGIV